MIPGFSSNIIQILGNGIKSVAPISNDTTRFPDSPATPADRFINLLNRLGRPMGWIGILFFMIYPWFDPSYFALIMDTYASVPEWIQYLVITLAIAFFTGRIVTSVRTNKRSTDTKTIMETEKLYNERRFNNLTYDNPILNEPIESELETVTNWKNRNYP